MKLAWRPGPRSLALIVVGGVAGLELVLMALGYGGRLLLASSERHGLRFLPDQVAVVHGSNVPMRINAYGFRGREWEPPPVDAGGAPLEEPDVLRVAMLGHSVTTGGWEPLEQTFGGVLEQRLRDELARRGDARRALVMNFAVPGHNLDYMERTYETLVRPYRPDVLVANVTGPDIRPLPPPRPPPELPLRNVLVRSAIYHFLSQEVAGVPPKVLRGPANSEEEEEFRVATALCDRVQADPFDPEFEPLWDEAYARMERMRLRQLEHGGVLVVSALVELRDLAFGKNREWMGARWAKWADGREGVVVVDPLPGFRAAFEPLLVELREKGLRPLQLWRVEGKSPELEAIENEEHSPFLFFTRGHYSRLGHELVGEALFRGLVGANLVAGSV